MNNDAANDYHQGKWVEKAKAWTQQYAKWYAGYILMTVSKILCRIIFTRLEPSELRWIERVFPLYKLQQINISNLELV
jgi:hypothetical protein